MRGGGCTWEAFCQQFAVPFLHVHTQQFYSVYNTAIKHSLQTGAHCLLQVPKDPMSQQAVWLYEAASAEPVGGALGERMQVHTGPVPMVLQESTQQRSE